MAPAISTADRADLNRAARIITAISIAGPVVAELLHPWIIRFPAIGAIVAALEVLWSTYAKRPSASSQAASIPAQSPPPPSDSYLS